jgi:emp24/gp25L/p24 family/GOLD
VSSRRTSECRQCCWQGVSQCSSISDDQYNLQDWDAIAKKDNLNDMSTELRRLEAMVKEIHQEMLFLRSREEEMRNINGVRIMWTLLEDAGNLLVLVYMCNCGFPAPHKFEMDAEATNARVAWFSIGSLFVCIFLAAWQLWYLKVGVGHMSIACRSRHQCTIGIWALNAYLISINIAAACSASSRRRSYCEA